MLLFGSITFNAQAQLQFATVEAMWQYADAHNIDIAASQTNVGKAKINTRQAYGALLPTVTANGSFTDNITLQPTLIPANLFNPAIPAGTYTEATFGRRYLYNSSLAAQVNVFNMQDWFQVKAARLNEQLALAGTGNTKANMYEQLATAYYTYLLLTEAELLSRQNATTTNVMYELANNKYTEGLISEITLNNARIQQQKAVKSLQSILLSKQEQLTGLQLLLNTKDSIRIDEKISVQLLSLTDSFAVDPATQVSYQQMLVAQNQWKSTKAALAPTLSAVYQYNRQVAADKLLQFENSNTIPQQYWGLRLSIPLFAGNTKRLEIQKAQQDYLLKQQQYSNSKLVSVLNDQQLTATYTGRLTTYQQAKNILALYASNDAHAERKLQEGLLSLDDRLKYYTDLITSQNDYLQSMSDYLIEVYRIKIRQTRFIP